MKNLSLLIVLACAGAGCATERYGFRPASAATTSEAGFPASHYSVPPEAPRGEVYVTSFGTREVETGGRRTDLVHVRLAVANQSDDRAWGVDPAQQVLLAAGAPAEKPAFMEIDGRRGGSPTVERGQRRVIDLYYDLPAGTPDAAHLPSFDYQWQVDAGGKVVSERTPFVREAYRDYGESETSTTVAVGVGGPWWAFGYGPWWWGGYGMWGYPYYGPYGYGPYVGFGLGFRGAYRPYSYGGPRYGGGYGGGFSGGGRGVRVAPSVRGRPGR